MSCAYRASGVLLAFAIAIGLNSATVHAASYWNVAGPGAWETTGNWTNNADHTTPSGEPTVGDTTVFGDAYVTGGTAQITQAGEVSRRVWLGYVADKSGTLEISSGSLTVGMTNDSDGGYLRVGERGIGTVNQSGGAVVLGFETDHISELQLALYASAVGAYNLSGGTLTAGDIVYGAGTGTIHQTGGTITVTDGVVNGAGAGTLHVDNGAMTVGNGFAVDNLRVGYEGGTATLTVSGGAVTVGTGSNSLRIGFRDTGDIATTGTVDFSGADSVALDLARLHLGIDTTGDSSGDNKSVVGILTLSSAGSNTIDATEILLGSTNSAQNASVVSELNLGGAANTISTDTFTIGGSKSKGVVDIVAGGTLTLGGISDTKTAVRIGYNAQDTGTNPSESVLDLTGGTFNATLSTVEIGRHDRGGGSGKGKLIMDAGTVTADSITLAQVSVEGTSSTPSNTTGTLQVNGGAITVSGSVTDGGGVSTINVDNGAMTVGNGFAVDNLRVGYNGGNGALTVNGGAFVVNNAPADVSIGCRDTTGSTSSAGTLDLGAAASVNFNIDDLFIGITNNAGTARGELILGASNTITADEIRIGDSSSPGQEGVTSRIELNGTTSIAANLITIAHRKSTGVVEFGTNGGTLNLGSSSERIGDLRIGYNDHAGTGTHSNGTLDLTGGTATVYVDNVVLGQHNKPSSETNGSGTGTLNVGAGNLFDATSIVFAETVDANANAIGNLNLSGGALRAGTIDVDSGGNTNTANFNWTGGTLSVDYFGFDLLQNGSSTILAPGNSPGITTIDGDYTLASGTLQIEIVDTQYDQLIVNGDVSLAGELQVLLNGSGTGGATSLDDLYWIINNTGENDVLGEFSNFAEGEPVNIGGQNYYVYYHAQYGTSSFYGGNDVLLSTIPEPSTFLALLGLLGMGLLGYPRRRHRS